MPYSYFEDPGDYYPTIKPDGVELTKNGNKYILKNPYKDKPLNLPKILVKEMEIESINLLLQSCKFLSLNANNKKLTSPTWANYNENKDMVCLFAEANKLDFRAKATLHSLLTLYKWLESHFNSMKSIYYVIDELQPLRQYIHDKKIIKFLAKENEKITSKNNKFIEPVNSYVKKNKTQIKAEKLLPVEIKFEAAMKQNIYKELEFTIEIIDIPAEKANLFSKCFLPRNKLKVETTKTSPEECSRVMKEEMAVQYSGDLPYIDD